MTGKYSKPEGSVKDKEGRPITEFNDRNKWVEYFEELLKRPASLNPPDIKAAHTDLFIHVTPPKTETSLVMRHIKSGEAVGPDNILAEALKSDISNCKHAPHT
ncbi:unnamed protein product [Schistosoma curassoni]|uniref:RPAP1_N domain-containing protein n=1 Tax=Schistosoma curassoni TaxID=6186 RepID=A0A183L1Z9_9TREM|nr:unnamed protein product [Schistosoma curassoni]